MPCPLWEIGGKAQTWRPRPGTPLGGVRRTAAVEGTAAIVSDQASASGPQAARHAWAASIAAWRVTSALLSASLA